MNRLSRRSLKLQSHGHLTGARQYNSSKRPPLRGRLAAVASPRLKQEFSKPVIRPRPAIVKSVKRNYQDTHPKPNPEPKPLLLKWQWLIILILLAILLLVIFD